MTTTFGEDVPNTGSRWRITQVLLRALLNFADPSAILLLCPYIREFDPHDPLLSQSLVSRNLEAELDNFLAEIQNAAGNSQSRQLDIQ